MIDKPKLIKKTDSFLHKLIDEKNYVTSLSSLQKKEYLKSLKNEKIKTNLESYLKFTKNMP